MLSHWEFNILNLYDYTRGGAYKAYFDFLRTISSERVCTTVEFGVYKGRTLLSVAILLKELGIRSRVFGFDSFCGFPPPTQVTSEKDKFDYFDKMREEGRLSESHYKRIKLNERHLKFLGKSTDYLIASSSGDFSATNVDHILRKAKYLGVEDSVELIEGYFNDTVLSHVAQGIVNIDAAFVDCDLYASYLPVLPYVWERLAKGGIVFLDEYYSLKFPGPRMAVDEFLQTLEEDSYLLANVATDSDDFERWTLTKI